MVSEPLLDIRNVSVSFGGVHALKDVSFSVAEGSITAVIGPNGAGKTTMFNVLSGFAKPKQGQVVLAGEDITSLAIDKRAGRGFARTFQNISLYPGMTVLENIKLGAHTHMKTSVLSAGWFWGGAQREEVALRQKIEEEIIDFLEIDHIRNHYVSMLPYGYLKRVELARALAMQPKVLLLDEPVAGMNHEETEDMARFILDLQEQRGVTILLVEHDMSMVMDISNHVAVLNFGEVIATGAPAQVQASPAVIEAYLGAEAA
ncbi:MAG: ABC transporter ATP-binding protein [Pseudomonadota bacterium]